jgi:hypothetical protein
MTDDRKQQREEAKERDQVARLRLRRAWEREGYRPRAHLDGIAGEGDVGVMLGFGSRERHFVDASWPTREQKVPAVLALWDIHEIVNHSREFRQRRISV